MDIIQPILTAAQAAKDNSDDFHTGRSQSKWWQQKRSSCTAPDPKPGDQCPACGEGVLNYDSLFLLTCDQCGQTAESGAFT